MTGFDPYHKWLGIPPEQQPPNHYRLLGIELFEADPDAISNAADRQMTHVRSFQTGQNSEVSQRLLNEIAAARVCLLDPAKKFAYDRGLKEQLRPQVTPVASRHSTSWANTQIVLLTLAAAAVCVLVVVLLLSRSRPTVARTVATEESAQAQEASPAKPRKEEKDVKPEQEAQTEPKREPQPVVETTSAPATDVVTTVAPQTISEGPVATPAAPDPVASTANTGKSAGFVDLLSRVDLDRDFVSGKWTKEGGGLTASPGSRVRLPVKVNGSYDLRVTFTRLKGDSDVALLLPVGSHQCGLFFSAWNGQAHGLSVIDGQDALKNPISKRPGPLTNGRQYTALVKVRLTKGENASIGVLLDNSPLVRWQGKEAALALREDRMIRPYQIGLGTWDAVATFHFIRPSSGWFRATLRGLKVGRSLHKPSQ